MPQLDVISFPSQYVSVALLFLALYGLVTLVLFPLTARTLRARALFSSRLAKQRLFFMALSATGEAHNLLSYNLLMGNDFFVARFDQTAVGLRTLRLFAGREVSCVFQTANDLLSFNKLLHPALLTFAGIITDYFLLLSYIRLLSVFSGFATLKVS